jgi:hypothetical protein
MKYSIQSVTILLLFFLDILNGLRLCRRLSGLSRRILSNYNEEGSKSYRHRNRLMTRLVIDPTTTIDDFIVLNHDNSTSNNQNLSPSSLLAPSSLSQELLKQQRKKKSSNQESSSEVGIIPTYQNLNESLGEGAFNASQLFSKFPR